MIESRGDLRRDRGLRQHLREIKQKVVVIEHVLALLHLHVRCEERTQRDLVRRRPREPRAERLFKLARRIDDARIDRQARRFGGKPLLRLAEAGFMPRPIHKIGRILAVMDGELRIEPEAARIFAQESGADGVECPRIGRRRRCGGLRRETAGEQAFDTTAKLSRRAPREGREHDALRVGTREDERRHPMRQHRRLTRPRAGDDEQGPCALRIVDPIVDQELLLGIEFNGGARANRGERRAKTQSCFALCSQGLARPSGRATL